MKMKGYEYHELKNRKGNLSWMSLVKEFLSKYFLNAHLMAPEIRRLLFLHFFFNAKLEAVTAVVKRDEVFLIGVHRRVSIVLQII